MASSSKEKKIPRGKTHRSAQALSDLKTILDSINDGVFTVDGDYLVTSFNKAAETITGVPEEEALGRHCWEVFRADICEGECALKQTIATSRPVINKPVKILTASGRGVPISVSTALLKDKRGRVMGGVESFRDLSLVEELRKEVEQRYSFRDMLSENHKMREIFNLLPLVAESESTVLVVGESGTGKELMAKAIHHLSSRERRPLVTVNCGALPDTLLESELFGHVAGAFTGAKGDRPGRLEAARGGTLFLDEIGDVSPALQVRLLRVLQEKTFERLGSNTPIRADVRFIAATHRDLREEVRRGTFREDLFYRLNVVQIAIPPLRQRREDVPLLARHFVAKLNRLRGRDIQDIAPEAMERLMRHDWPGNVRELENAIEHAFILCRQGVILPEYLPASIGGKAAPAPTAVEGARAIKDAELSLIRAALERHGGNRSAAARELGIHKTTLWRKLKRDSTDS